MHCTRHESTADTNEKNERHETCTVLEMSPPQICVRFKRMHRHRHMQQHGHMHCTRNESTADQDTRTALARARARQRMHRHRHMAIARVLGTRAARLGHGQDKGTGFWRRPKRLRYPLNENEKRVPGSRCADEEARPPCVRSRLSRHLLSGSERTTEERMKSQNN